MVERYVKVNNQVLTIMGMLIVMVMVVVGILPFGRTTQVGEHNTSHGGGMDSNHGNSLFLRGRGWASNSTTGTSSPMGTLGRGQASAQAQDSSSLINF